MKSINCLRCDVPMDYQGPEQIQLGKTGFLTGTLSNLAAGALEVAVYCCPRCGKLEFFSREAPGDRENGGGDDAAECGGYPNGETNGDSPDADGASFYGAGGFPGEDGAFSVNPRSGLLQRTCPNCDTQHDFDYPRCPNCGHAYPEFL